MRGLKQCALIASCLVLPGCFPDPVQDINRLARPVVIVAVSPERDVTVRGSDGTLVTLGRDYFLAKTLSSMAPGTVVRP